MRLFYIYNIIILLHAIQGCKKEFNYDSKELNVERKDPELPYRNQDNGLRKFKLNRKGTDNSAENTNESKLYINFTIGVTLLSGKTCERRSGTRTKSVFFLLDFELRNVLNFKYAYSAAATFK